MARWDDETVRRVRERTDLVALVGETVRLRRVGRRYVGLCPFHAERTPSFGVSPERGLFHCFGCGAGGDAFDFVMRRDGLTFPQALEMLATRAGVELPGGAEDPAAEGRRREREQLYAALAEAERWYRQQLAGPEGTAARRYLASRRVGREVAAAFGLGYAPPGKRLLAHLSSLGFAEGALAEAGLLPRGEGGDRLGGRLILPIRDEHGRTVGFGARVLGEGEPRYLNSPEGPLFVKRRLLYGLDRARAAIRRRGEALVVEGYFDVLACHAAGFDHAVATLGTAFGPDAVAILRRQGARVVFAYDADAAGVQAAKAALAACDRAEVPARAARLEGGKDPAEVLAAEGRTALERALEGALARVPFVLETAVREGRTESAEGKAEVAREVLAAVAEHPSEVARAAYLREVAARLEVPEESLARELMRLSRGGTRAVASARTPVHRREKNGNDIPSRRRLAHGGREEELAALVLNAPEMGRAIGVDPGRFRDEAVARLVAAALGGGLDAIPEDLRPRAAALALRGEERMETYADPEAVARDLWRRLEEDFERAQRALWRERIADMERRGENPPAPYLEAVRREVRRGE
ncbi:MAG: DNA primase [Firmicutes bacterium]|nr:DNA primase [Bacillota bacterium]